MLVPSAVTHHPLVQGLTAQLSRLVGESVPKDLAKARFVSDTSGDMASLRLLAASRLVFGKDDRIDAYCRAVVDNAFKPANLKTEKEPLTGQYYLMDDRFWAKDASYDKEWSIGFILQGLWSYSYYCDDTAILRRYWNRIRGLYRYYQIVFDWPTGSTWTLATGGGANSDGTRIAWEGMLAMARMARAVGDDGLYRDSVTRSARQMMSLYACWFGVKWAADHDYVIDRNRQIPAFKAETRFAPDACWNETFTASSAHTSDFFQVTHALWIYNLSNLLFYHDFGLDELRLRKWEFDSMPQLHPAWADGNVMSPVTKHYYGNDGAMAHLIVRALLFHQDTAELYALYRKSTDHTRVLEEWYSPMGTAPLALAAMITGAAPLVIVPVQDYQVLENTYDAEARRQRVVLEPRDATPGPLRIRCWGMAPNGATCNGAPVAIRYDPTTDYATLPLQGASGAPWDVEVRYP